MKKLICRALLMILVMTILCGGLYTLAVTGISSAFFPQKANGSIIEVNGKQYGSELLAQQFEDDSHLWGRIMNIDTKTFKDSSGEPLMYAWPSNLSPASEEYKELISKRVEKIRAVHPDKADSVPVELVTCSGSGLDPHISVKAAKYQVSRIAKATGKSEEEVEKIIDRYSEKRFLFIFGEERVNVLKVNLALDGILSEE